jgi:hypothetical protein
MWRLPSTSYRVPRPPPPLYGAARQGATSHVLCWAPPIRALGQGPGGHWASLVGDQPNSELPFLRTQIGLAQTAACGGANGGAQPDATGPGADLIYTWLAVEHVCMWRGR